MGYVVGQHLLRGHSSSCCRVRTQQRCLRDAVRSTSYLSRLLLHIRMTGSSCHVTVASKPDVLTAVAVIWVSDTWALLLLLPRWRGRNRFLLLTVGFV